MAANYFDLDEANDERALTLLPVKVIISIYMIIGILGNSLVLLYYGCYAKPTSSNNFIVAMAVFDITVCCVSMPLEIVNMEMPLKFPSKTACKILRFVNYFASLSSGFTLVAVAIDRYRKVCQPFKTQITMKMAKVMIAIACLFSFIVSWPAFVLYDIVPVNTSFADVIGYDCTTLRNSEFTLFVTIYNGVCFLIFLGSFSSLTVLYIAIGRKLFLLKKFRVAVTKGRFDNVSDTNKTSDVGSKSKGTGNTPSALRTEDNSSTENNNTQNLQRQSFKSENLKLKQKVIQRAEPYGIIICQEGTSESGVKKKRLKLSEASSVEPYNSKLKAGTSLQNVHLSERQKNVKDQYINLKRYTVLMLSITTACVLSFLPYICLMIWRTLVPKHEGNMLSNSELVAFSTFINSWMLSSVVNPVIYGFFNTDFRIFVSALFYRCFHCIKLTQNSKIV